eukprot:3806777-Amphidinium_carterae.1
MQEGVPPPMQKTSFNKPKEKKQELGLSPILELRLSKTELPRATQFSNLICKILKTDGRSKG